MTKTKRNYVIAVLAAVSVTVAAYIILLQRSERFHEVSLESGTELFSIDPADIKTFKFDTQTFLLLANRREKGKNGFDIEISRKNGHPVEQCQGGGVFISLLNTFATIKAMQSSEAVTNSEQYTISIGTVLIGDYSALEPSQWRFMASSDKATVVANDGMQMFIVNVPYSAFQTLIEGCTRLSL